MTSSAACGSSSRTSALFMPEHAATARGRSSRRSPCRRRLPSPRPRPRRPLRIALDPVIPTGSRLEPRSRRTRAAPSSTRSRPWAGFAYRSQSLKLEALPALGGEAGPDRPRRRRPRPASRPRCRCRSSPGCRPRSPSRRRRPCCACRPSRRPRCGRRSPCPRARRSRSTSAISSRLGSVRGIGAVERRRRR